MKDQDIPGQRSCSGTGTLAAGQILFPRTIVFRPLRLSTVRSTLVLFPRLTTRWDVGHSLDHARWAIPQERERPHSGHGTHPHVTPPSPSCYWHCGNPSEVSVHVRQRSRTVPIGRLQHGLPRHLDSTHKAVHRPQPSRRWNLRQRVALARRVPVVQRTTGPHQTEARFAGEGKLGPN